MTPGNPIDFDKEIQKMASDSFNKGVGIICDSLIDTFKGIAIRDPAIPQEFTALQVINIMKGVRAQVVMNMPEPKVVGK